MRVDVASRTRARQPKQESGAGLLFFLGLLFLLALGAVAIFFVGSSRTVTVLGPPTTNLSTTATASVLPADAPELDPLAEARSVLEKLPANSRENLLLDILMDTAKSDRERRAAIAGLAELGTPAAIAALEIAFTDGSTQYKSAIAEALALTNNPEARRLVQQILDGEDENAVLGALRGMAMAGNPADVQPLAAILGDPNRAEDLRIEAALALSEMQTPAAAEALRSAAVDVQNEPVAAQAIEALGRLPWDSTGSFFTNYLANPNVPNSLKAAALEAVGTAQGDTSSVLLGYATSEDDELRAAAAWGLLSVQSNEDLSPALLAWVAHETESEIRSRLYQALAEQPNPDPRLVLELAQKETDPRAKLDIMSAAATSIQANPDSELAQHFKTTMLPQLTALALQASSTQDRLTALITLGKSGTPEARRALEMISMQTSLPEIREHAAELLKRRTKE